MNIRNLPPNEEAIIAQGWSFYEASVIINCNYFIKQKKEYDLAIQAINKAQEYLDIQAHYQINHIVMSYDHHLEFVKEWREKIQGAVNAPPVEVIELAREEKKQPLLCSFSFLCFCNRAKQTVVTPTSRAPASQTMHDGNSYRKLNKI